MCLSATRMRCWGKGLSRWSKEKVKRVAPVGEPAGVFCAEKREAFWGAYRRTSLAPAGPDAPTTARIGTCRPMGFSPTSVPEGFQRTSGKPFGAPVGAYPLPRRGMTRRLRRERWGCRPDGGSTFFRSERKYQRKPAARRLRRRPTSLCTAAKPCAALGLGYALHGFQPFLALVGLRPPLVAGFGLR